MKLPSKVQPCVSQHERKDEEEEEKKKKKK
jgi:hypothetical protein